MVDAHLDLAWNALQWNRDLRESVQVLRVREATEAGPGRGRNTVALPELRAGAVRLCFATVLARSSGTVRAHVDFASAEQANAIALGQLAYYRALERGGHVRVLSDRIALDAHVGAADAGDPGEPLGVVLAMEGADPILEPDDLGDWAAAGLRTVGLAHYGPGRCAGGTGTSTGLTDLGRALLPQLDRAGIALDLTHLSDAAFWEAIEAFEGPVHVSHGNCRALVPNQRQLSDDQIRAVAERGGVIGMALDAWMLEPGWVKGHSRRDGVRLERVVDHVDHVCALTQSTAFVGIGSDLDGGFGTEQSPEGLDTIADLARLEDLLTGRGYAPADVARVMHGNWVRCVQEWWSEGTGI
ncbi:MAG: peptidase M19 [Trueperaceae bacterium]|nr:MAG: peptidase M19 [Trueperaceae bacterium]